jgi:hypothetical protein
MAAPVYASLIPVRPCALRTISVCLRTISVCLRTISVCLRKISVSLRTISVCLRTIRVCLRTISVCLRTTSVCLRTTSVSLRTISVSRPVLACKPPLSPSARTVRARGVGGPDAASAGPAAVGASAERPASAPPRRSWPAWRSHLPVSSPSLGRASAPLWYCPPPPHPHPTPGPRHSIYLNRSTRRRRC